MMFLMWLWNTLCGKHPDDSFLMTQMMQDIMKLSVSEGVIMVEAIWDSIPIIQSK